jgi:hypothetical protein
VSDKKPFYAMPDRQPARQIAMVTACRHCPEKFYGPKTVLRIGETPPQRFYKYLAEINEHIAKAHPKEFEKAFMLGTELQGMLVLANYDTADPEVIDQRNYYRWKVHQATLQATIDDVTIERKTQELIDEVMKAPDIRVAMKEAIGKRMRELRDILQEPGVYTEDGRPAGT